jgi:hypothetical protein
MIVYNKTTLGILAIVATLGILTASTALTLQPAHALSKFFNCTTDVANKTHNLTLEDVNACYNKEFHSSGGPGTGITPTTIPTHITTTQSGEYRGSLHHHHGTTITSIHSPSSSSEGSHRAHNEGFSSSSAAAAAAASIDELLRGYSGVHSSSSSVSGDAAASSSSSSGGGASASASATSR